MQAISGSVAQSYVQLYRMSIFLCFLNDKLDYNAVAQNATDN